MPTKESLAEQAGSPGLPGRRGLSSLPNFVWVYVILFGALLLMGVIMPGSLAPKHLMDLLRQAAPLGVVSIGQTLLLASGNIDLSFGPQITLCNLVLSTLMKAGGGDSILWPVFAALLVAVVVGLINGLAVTRLRIPPFVATLAMGLLIQGAYLIYTGGSPAGGIAPRFRVIAEGWIGGFLPWAAVIWLGTSAGVALVLHRSKLGRYLFAVGGNPRASFLSGLPVHMTTVSIYVIGSLLAALSGFLISAYIGLASTGVGEPYTLNSIASSVIGGTPFTGGEGTIAGTFGGALIMVVLQAILTGLNTGDAGKLISQGIVIAVMVGVYQRRIR